MKIPWIKLIVGAVAAEIAAIVTLVGVVALFGPREASQAQIYAEKMGWWVGPIAGVIFSFIGAFWIARPAAAGPLLVGTLFGCLYALIDVALLIAMQASFEWIFVVSDAGKILAGVGGGLLAARAKRGHTF